MRRTACAILLTAIAIAAIGCSARAQRAEPSGFLTAYDTLQESETEPGVLRYERAGALSAYRRFLIEPIGVVPHPKADLDRVPIERLDELTQWLETALREELGSAYTLVDAPGPGVLRLRAAITDVDPATPLLNLHPATKLTGLGLGGASFEAEGLDAITGERVFAVLVSRDAAKRIGSGLGEWADARQVMRDWAAQFRARVDAAHASAPAAGAE
ncbi:MAG: DUF3313 domain-containing protein [Phycisphaerales bacterium]